MIISSTDYNELCNLIGKNEVKDFTVLDDSAFPEDGVKVGDTITWTLNSKGVSRTFTRTLVLDSPSLNAEISIKSPVGQALYGKRESEIIDINLQNSNSSIKIEEIQKNNKTRR